MLQTQLRVQQRFLPAEPVAEHPSELDTHADRQRRTTVHLQVFDEFTASSE